MGQRRHGQLPYPDGANLTSVDEPVQHRTGSRVNGSRPGGTVPSIFVMRSRLNSESRLPGVDSGVLHVVFGAMNFELEGPSALLAQVARVPTLRVVDQKRRATLESHPRGLDTLHVRLRFASEAELERKVGALGARAIEWQASGDQGQLATRWCHAEWQLVRSKLYAEAKLSDTGRSAESLLVALATLALQRAGGAVLHAASVELPFGIVAFIGPSGAGKSTACRHVLGAPTFCVDRLAVVPICAAARGAATWLAAPLPGGTGLLTGRDLGTARGKPLALVLRVRQATKGARIEQCSRLEAVTCLRESAFHPARDAQVELQLIARLDQLRAEVAVANLHWGLGSSLEPSLQRFWSEQRITSAHPLEHSIDGNSQAEA